MDTHESGFPSADRLAELRNASNTLLKLTNFVYLAKWESETERRKYLVREILPVLAIVDRFAPLLSEYESAYDQSVQLLRNIHTSIVWLINRLAYEKLTHLLEMREAIDVAAELRVVHRYMELTNLLNNGWAETDPVTWLAGMHLSERYQNLPEELVTRETDEAIDSILAAATLDSSSPRSRSSAHLANEMPDSATGPEVPSLESLQAAAVDFVLSFPAWQKASEEERLAEVERLGSLTELFARSHSIVQRSPEDSRHGEPE